MNENDVMVILNEIFLDIHEHIKSLAPQNSKYVSMYEKNLVDFIFVDGKRVYTNTGKLKNSIMFESSKDLYVTKSVGVPYYEKAVLRPTITVAYHYFRTEYGMKRYHATSEELAKGEYWRESVEYEKENRNYLYYMKAKDYIQHQLGTLSGTKFIIKG